MSKYLNIHKPCEKCPSRSLCKYKEQLDEMETILKDNGFSLVKNGGTILTLHIGCDYDSDRRKQLEANTKVNAGDTGNGDSAGY